MKNKRIIYDDTCPMCKWYTGEFVERGLLEENARIPFSQLDAAILEKIDKDRCRHEIPLYDVETGETIYGYEALFLILEQKWTFFRPLFQNKLFKTFIYYLYQIVSYNRRIIAASPKTTKGFDSNPDFHLAYRSLYILLAFGVATMLALRFISIGFDFHQTHIPYIIYTVTAVIALVVVMGIPCEKRVSYWGHLATVLLIDNLLAIGIIFLFSLLGGMSPLIWTLSTIALTLFGANLFWKRMLILNS